MKVEPCKIRLCGSEFTRVNVSEDKLVVRRCCRERARFDSFRDGWNLKGALACSVTTPILKLRIESLAKELMIAVIDDSHSYCSCRVLPLCPDYISIS